MARWNKKSKLITGIAIAGAAVVSVGAVALLSKGFKNMDVRDWVGGYEHVLEVSEDAQYLCATCGTEGTWKQDSRAKISFKSEDENVPAHSSVKLIDQDGDVFKRANVTISANVTLKGETMAGITFGYDLTSSGPNYYGHAFILDYDADSKLLRVVVHPDYSTWESDSEQHSLPTSASVYSNSYSLSYYGLNDLNNIKFSVKKTVSATGSVYEVKVGNKTIDFLTSCDDNGNFVIKDLESACNSKGACPVYLTAYGTEATFKGVKWSE